MRRGQRSIRPDDKEDRHTCLECIFCVSQCWKRERNSDIWRQGLESTDLCPGYRNLTGVWWPSKKITRLLRVTSQTQGAAWRNSRKQTVAISNRRGGNVRLPVCPTQDEPRWRNQRRWQSATSSAGDSADGLPQRAQTQGRQLTVVMDTASVATSAV